MSGLVVEVEVGVLLQRLPRFLVEQVVVVGLLLRSLSPLPRLVLQEAPTPLERQEPLAVVALCLLPVDKVARLPSRLRASARSGVEVEVEERLAHLRRPLAVGLVVAPTTTTRAPAAAAPHQAPARSTVARARLVGRLPTWRVSVVGREVQVAPPTGSQVVPGRPQPQVVLVEVQLAVALPRRVFQAQVAPDRSPTASRRLLLARHFRQAALADLVVVAPRQAPKPSALVVAGVERATLRLAHRRVALVVQVITSVVVVEVVERLVVQARTLAVLAALAQLDFLSALNGHEHGTHRQLGNRL